MANEEQLALLLKGVDIWNGWRADYPDEEINLMGADLSGAKLTQANLSQVSLYNANLSHADLSHANLVGANLFNANLSGADLSFAKLAGGKLYNANLQDASLVGAELHGTNLTSANLTGAWLEKWQINSDTKLEQVDCQYVYLNRESDQQSGKRVPNDRDFEPGEFSAQFGIQFNFISLDFTERINWQGVAIALQSLKTQHADQQISMQGMAIAQGLLSLNLLVSGELDRNQIEDQFWQIYQSKAKKRLPKSDEQGLDGAIDRLIMLAQKA
jgi:hypothetical protein